MKLNLHNIGNLRVVLTTVASVFLCVSFLVAEEITDFEKLLQEAIQSSQTEKTTGVSSTKAITVKKDTDSAGTARTSKLREPIPIKSAVKPLPAESTESVEAKFETKATQPKAEAGASDGWTALKPNETADKTAKTTDAKPIRVADASRPGIDPNAAVWDAVPETVSEKDAKPESFATAPSKPAEKPVENLTQPTAKQPFAISAEKAEEKATEKAAEKTDKAELPTTAKTIVIQPSASPWDLPAETPTTEPAPIDWNVVANGRIDEKADNKSAKTETATEPVKEPEQKVVAEATKPVTKPAETLSTAKPKAPVDDAMNSILDSLAKESQEEKKVSDASKTDKADKKESDVAQKDDVKDAKKEAAKETSVAKKEDKKDEKADEKGDELTEPKPLELAAPAKQTAPKTEPAQPEPVVPAFDSDDDETVYKVVNADRVGDSHSKEKIKLMYDEIVNGLKSRNITGRYDMWKGYARSTLRSTAGLNTGSELDGRCRLSWYQQLYNEPIQSVFAVEEFSRKLHHALSGSHRHIAEMMPDIRKKMDVPERNDAGIRFLECKTPFDAVNEVKRCLMEAQMAHARALSTLTSAEQTELAKNLVPTFAGTGCYNGHTIPNRTYGRRLVDMMEKLNKAGMYDAAESLIPLTNTALLALLDKLPEDAFPTTMLSGQKVQRLSTSAGDIIIGGRENNIYDLDSSEMRDVVCVIDLGGNDIYRDGTCDLDRPVFAIIDLHGNDTYTGTKTGIQGDSGSKPGIQGGSVLGVSILIDAEGDDTYSAGDVAQGSTIGGAGMLFDFAGNDSYKALRRAQGHALEGLGILVDRKGHDKYRAALWAQGFGAPAGFGVLEDVEGNDQYYCGGLYLDSYPEHPGYDGWGQGIGAGIRQVANGGIGALLEGGGDDVYEVDYFGQGGGYWLGVGFVRDFAGNDIRHGTTKMAYTGGPRREREWTRFANGFGCHYSLGYCFDDAGNDVYGGTIMGTGMAWDLSIGYLCDFNGDDKFTATGGMTQGVGAEGSIGILFSYGGDDQFMGRNQAYSSSNITYHLPSNCGGNFSFLINYGGNDKYGCGAANNSYVQRGSSGGFLIDRPTDIEAASELEALKGLIEKRNQEITEYDEAVKKATEEAAAKGRRYVPRQRRPLPISADQQQRLGSVPSFDNGTKTGAEKTNVK